jgi:hypothetical protein
MPQENRFSGKGRANALRRIDSTPEKMGFPPVTFRNLNRARLVAAGAKYPYV